MPQGIIHPLSGDIIGQIAAGEVVERPASAVKELVENSIDAGATAITVDIRDGGITSLRVTDNGCGIYPEDILMAFKRHATSKIVSAEDLYSVSSLGFRGEALSSIAAAGKVTLRTRRRGAETGVEAVNEGGQMVSVTECACPEGTVIQVRELFFNAPVRRKFLKKPAMETALVGEMMQRFILSRPDIAFRFTADGRNVYFSPGDGELRHAAMAVFPLAMVKQMAPVDDTQGGVRLTGLVGTGDASRGNRAQEFFFLNGRTFRSGILSLAVEEACRQLVTIGRYPVCALHIQMPYDRVDVNVHPNKWEVRFADEAAVREAVRLMVSDALRADHHTQDRIPPVFYDSVEAPRPQPAAITRSETLPPVGLREPREEYGARQQAAFFGAKVDLAENKTVQAPAAAPEKAPAAPVPEAAKEAAPVPKAPPQPEPEQAQMALEDFSAGAAPRMTVTVLGTAFSTYILVEAGEDLLLCDQHAMHERLLYEDLMRQAGGKPPIQALLIPRAVALRDKEFTVCMDNLKALYQAGFDVEPFGNNTVMIRGLPLILGEPQAESCFHAALDELQTRGSITELEKVQRLTQMACKHAVKGGEHLDDESIRELVEKCLREDIRLTCPHGRPLMIRLTKTDIEKRFKRIQEAHE